jgi:hypothetical protein
MSYHFSALNRRLVGLLVCAAALSVLASDAHAKDEKSIRNFRDAIIGLGPGVDPHEAELISQTAHRTARRLAKEYRVVGPSVFQNFLIHMGARTRGFCFHWAHDIGAELKQIRPKTLDLHWGAADPGKSLEHNVVVVTARGQPFDDGYIIDGWRMAGRLVWLPVKKDRTYRFKEDMRETAWLQNYRLKDQTPALRTARRTPASPLQASATGLTAPVQRRSEAAPASSERSQPQAQVR